ncbi:glycosyltransferase [Ammoniphilus sp. YIM 78166]|uniref:glycosyltransferase n=1 Tax=Ammoniphilus sp. YIM 78166 TaxID=1644106 RepID=UPI00106FCBD0|nr:glycosyltransferase [Ammoniphilus sp. YIM 78166]
MIHYIVGRNLGHLSRCVANIEKYKKIGNQSIKVFTFPHSHSWIRSNLPKVKVKDFSKKKLAKNPKPFLDAQLIIHDWRKEVEWLKKSRGKKGPIIGGIYHSDMFTTGEDSEWTTTFKNEIREVADKTTDIFFHMNLLPPKRSPKLSSYYYPIPIISREISMSPKKVKKILGLKPDERFILIHMGGGIGPFRYRYMDEWYEKLSRIKTPYRLVVANQFGGMKAKFPKSIIVAPLFTNGPDLINAADMVISKPGMGIMIDCITTGTPLLALPADSKERQVKNMMLKDLIGHDLCLVRKNASAQYVSKQVQEYMDESDRVQHVFERIPRNGADVMARCMKKLSNCSIRDLPDLYPDLLKLSPYHS